MIAGDLLDSKAVLDTEPTAEVDDIEVQTEKEK